MKVSVTVQEAVQELFDRVIGLEAEVEQLRSRQTTVEVERPEPEPEPDWRELAVTMAGAWWRLTSHHLVRVAGSDDAAMREASHLWGMADEASSAVRQADVGSPQ